MSRTKRWLLIYLPAAIIALTAFLYYQNNAISITTIKLSSSKLPHNFEAYRIVQLSDLHNKLFGKEQRRIIRKINKLKPDLIVVTGDLIDSRRYDEEISLILMRGIVDIAPVYYVTGNHEQSSGRFGGLEKKLLDAGVHVLRNANDTIKLGDGVVRLVGVDDPIFNKTEDGDVDKINRHLQLAYEGLDNPDAYTILLSHRPELFSIYEQHGIDLTLAGHAHGGQFIIPFVGGVIAPEQGFWPRYYAGKYESGQSVMIVNRGLGNSVIPQRLFNRPEIVLVELTQKK